VITAFICHVGYEVTSDVVHRLADGIDPEVIRTAEAAAGSVPGVIHAHARARWTGRTLRVEIEGWVDPGMTARQADELGRDVADAIAGQLPEAGSLTWITRAAPGHPPRLRRARPCGSRQTWEGATRVAACVPDFGRC
jgi:divalent metal cation (Fe/Co/Zn/Cd) transporter